ncbi:MAG: phosphatase PAP2 family protein [Fidelibacterota bacterium]
MSLSQNIIEWLQGFDFPLIVYSMKAITLLGNESFYLFILPVIIWCYNKKIGLPLVTIIYGTYVINTFLKLYFGIPRPPESLHLVTATGLGFPSGHAQGAMALWGYLGWRFRQLPRVIPIIFLIGFSRVYLGVHSPWDVLAGWGFGFIFLWGMIVLLKRHEAGGFDLKPETKAFFVGGVALVLTFLAPDESMVKLSAVFAGVGVGLILEAEKIGGLVATTQRNQIFKILIGIGGAFLIKSGLKMIFPQTLLFDFIRYLVFGLWIGAGAPWVFVRTSLNRKMI